MLLQLPAISLSPKPPRKRKREEN